jgi:hypothetical protein
MRNRGDEEERIGVYISRCGGGNLTEARDYSSETVVETRDEKAAVEEEPRSQRSGWKERGRGDRVWGRPSRRVLYETPALPSNGHRAEFYIKPPLSHRPFGCQAGLLTLGRGS